MRVPTITRCWGSFHSAKPTALNAQIIADLIKQCVRLSAWGIFQPIWGVMNKLISIKAMKYKLFYRLDTLKMHITPMFRVATLRWALELRVGTQQIVNRECVA